MSIDVRLIAFYLPQFHPIPENDKWWGQGFTEWTNVTRGRSMYEGHDQPRRPAELGYYDLRVKEVRHRQAELAAQYGIHGFCYYYYWFSGRRLLERPLDLMLGDSELTFPFCVCWANENWTRRWDGSDHEILMEQKHLPDDPAHFIRDLAPVLKDPRYIRVNGAPLLLIYRAQIIPDLRGALRTWRRTAEELGIPRLHVCAVQSFGYSSGLEDGFDAMVEFPAHSIDVGEINDKIPGLSPRFKGKIYSYPEVVRHCLRLGSGARLPIYRGLITGWDNTARGGYTSHLCHNATPDHYEVWLRRLVDFTRRHHEGDDRLIFVNAWNEWAEGAYLEPDQTHQYRFLEATARAVFGVPAPGALISGLRQITAGHEEAQSLLTQLEHAIRINEQIVDLIDGRGVIPSDDSRDGFRGRFRPVERAGIRLPDRMMTNGVAGFLDVLNSPDYAKGVTLRCADDVLLMGWIASTGVEVDAHSPILFQLSNLESGIRYVAQVLSRLRRDDVVGHLQAHMPEACSRYSGYRAYLNIAAVEPGPYKLDAIIPTPDGNSGATMPLHASILVL